NPRFNGASYPCLIANKLSVAQWQSQSMNTKHRTLSTIDLDGIEYNPTSRSGVILINWGTVLAGHITAMFIGDPVQQNKLRAEFKKRLN
ncbi:ATP-grasp domain-containing protein, partial [bacterium]|nr:ATP-grasp domain-containing protein [bacterium]